MRFALAPSNHLWWFRMPAKRCAKLPEKTKRGGEEMAKKQSICTVCGYVGYPKRVAKGSFWLELALWLFFILASLVYFLFFILAGLVYPLFFAGLVCSLFFASLVYSLWRLTTIYGACPKCENASMIPIDTPRGQKLLEEQQKKEPSSNSG